MMLPDGTMVAEGTVSISLNDSWTGRQLLEGLGHMPGARYQQKHQLERDQRKTDLLAADVGGGKPLLLGTGKVRQMFDERRQKTVTGIDKSYPLQPIGRKGLTRGPAVSSQRNAAALSNNNNFGDGLLMASDGGGRNFNGNHLLSSHITSANFLDNEEFTDESLDETLPSDVFDHSGELTTANSSTRQPAAFATTMPIAAHHRTTTTNNNNSNMATSLKMNAVRTQVSNLSIKSRQQPATVKLAPVAAPAALIPPPTSAARSTAGAGGLRKLVPMKKTTTTTPLAAAAAARKTLTVARPAAPDRELPQSTPSSSTSRSSRQTSGTSSAMATANKTANIKPATPVAPPSPPTKRFAPAEPPGDNMAACGCCGRHFNVDRLDKHETICRKTAAKKRKIFDATTHRIRGTDAESFVQKQLRTQRIAVPVAKKGGAPVVTAAAVAKLAATTSPPPRRSDWRRQHAEFIAAIRSAKQVQVHLARGGKLSDLPPPPPSENPDYVQCPHCARRFNATAAERHIPKCATFQHNKPKAGAVGRK